ncbi:MAG: HAD family hydrolase [Kiritimatiellae bacterium]|nr:HAD family hydrolase [Kiritimatiellia bacterium]
MKYRHWFFDLDGTLARTGEDIVSAWKGALAGLGRDLSRFDSVFRIGPPLEQIVYELYDDATPELVADMIARFKPLYDESGFPNTVEYPGVPELLAAITGGGGKAYIVTNKRHSATVRLAGKFGWNRVMTAVRSFDSFETKCSKAGLIARLMGDFSAAPEEAVMVGDTAGDVEAGKANSIATAGVTYGYGSRGELAGADWIFDSAADIAKTLVK